jgi:hypothetical protein
MTGVTETLTFCGQRVTAEDLAVIRRLVNLYGGLSRTELASTICELLDWQRPNGGLKTIECRQFLESLHERSVIALPELRIGRPRGSRTKVVHSERGEAREPLTGTLRDVKPLAIERVRTDAGRALWRELVERYHYLGHRVPFGAHLRYLIRISEPEPQVIGCLQFSSPGWRMAARERWIGWNEEARKKRLQHIVNNSRFLILPWVQVRNLASGVLAQATRTVVKDWETQYGLRPWLVETLVDKSRFTGTCYRAANWIEVGETTGRGRQDRTHQRHGAAPKTVFLYPLIKNARDRLQGRPQ